jgi:hypothetical protein
MVSALVVVQHRMDCCMASQSPKRHGVISVHSLRTSWASLEFHLPSSIVFSSEVRSVVIHNSHPARRSGVYQPQAGLAIRIREMDELACLLSYLGSR